MVRRVRSIRIPLLLSLVVLTPTLAQAQPNPRVGTWKLNLGRSKFDPGPPPKTQTRTYEATADGGQKVTVDGIDGHDNKVSYSVAAKFDGKDYAYSGTGAPGQTIALTRIDDWTQEGAVKQGGTTVMTVRNTVSKDGKTMTITTKTTHSGAKPFINLQVFEKQ